MLYYIIYIINAVGARFIVFVPDFIAAAPNFTLSTQGLARTVGAVVGTGGSDNQLTATPIAVKQGSGMGVMPPNPLVARGMVVELCGMMVELRGMVVELRGMVVAASGLLPEGIVKLISRCEIVIANRDIMISYCETVIYNPETKMKSISVRMMAVGVALGVCVVIRVCFHIP